MLTTIVLSAIKDSFPASSLALTENMYEPLGTLEKSANVVATHEDQFEYPLSR